MTKSKMDLFIEKNLDDYYLREISEVAYNSEINANSRKGYKEKRRKDGR